MIGSLLVGFVRSCDVWGCLTSTFFGENCWRMSFYFLLLVKLYWDKTLKARRLTWARDWVIKEDFFYYFYY